MVQVQAWEPGARTGALGLADPGAADSARTGAKAARLAEAVAAGLPALNGFVIPAAEAAPTVEQWADIRAAWKTLTNDGTVPVVVRSSSIAEDGDNSSMAGQFTSILDVRGWDQFTAAVDQVMASRMGSPMAVLVQPFLRPTAGGVLFGRDPVTGDDHLVVAAVEGGPDQLVGGEVEGSYHVLNHRGRVIERRAGSGGIDLDERQCRALARLARTLAHRYGGPQDIEWAWDDDRIVLLQSRPITAAADVDVPKRAPLLGPGPIAETFPDPLSRLEEDLWLTPLAEGLAEALRLTGASSNKALTRSPIATTVNGRPVVDLALFGLAPVKHRLMARFDPRPPARRVVAAWRVGRLRTALPGLAHDLIATTDRHMRDVPALDTLTDAALLSLLTRTRQGLRAVHGHEVLMGLVLPDGHGPSAAGTALDVLSEARRNGVPDADVIANEPVVLSLVPPVIGTPNPLPDVMGLRPLAFTKAAAARDADPAVELREALRLRVRWLQELTARAALELGRRLHARGLVPHPHDVAHLGIDELHDAVLADRIPDDARTRSRPSTPPLPAMFRLTTAGRVVRQKASANGDRPSGVGAGGGRASGPVFTGEGEPPTGSVLLVAALEPGLAARLSRVAAVVAETGSPLSHLAILAREMGVPVVVGAIDARERFADGDVVIVDGDTGEVGAA